MVQAILAFIGIALAVPGTIVALIELRKKRSHSSEETRKQRTHLARAPLMLGLAAAGLASMAAAVMIHFFPPKQSPCAASPHATSVSASQSGSDLDLAVHIFCAPPTHYQYVLIREFDDVDPTNPHSEYYLTWEMGRPDPGDYQRRVNAKNSVGMFTTFIISVDDNEFAKLQAQAKASPRNFVLDLPPSNVVSNQVVVKPSN